MARDIDSVRALAKAVGVSEKAVRGWIARRDWAFGGTPPWKASVLEKIQKWRGSLQENRAEPPREGGGVTTEDAKRRYLIAKTGRELHKLHVEKGEVHSKAECEAEREETFQRVKGLILRDCRSQLSREVSARFAAMGRDLSAKEVLSIEDAYDLVLTSAFRFMSGEQ